MTVQYASDLHLEFPENRVFLKNKPLLPAGEVLLLAGDVMPFGEIEKKSAFWDAVSRDFKTVYWLPGNHEYYGSDAKMRSGAFKEALRPNVFLLNNAVVVEGGVTLIFATLWTAIGPDKEFDIAQQMNDYHLIRWGKERFLPAHSTRLHGESLRFIGEAVAAATTPHTVVVTHHVPTFLHYPAQYRHSPINTAFATELFKTIETLGATAWIYGHHHANTPAFTIGNTQLLTNQLGYVEYGEESGFRQEAILTL